MLHSTTPQFTFVKKLRDQQVPDAKGRTLPLTATRGQLHWSLYGGNNGLALIGRAEQVDSAHGLATSYACQNCCPDSFYDASCLPDPITGLPGNMV